MGNYHVSRILEEKKITDFLQERGIYPVKKSGEKIIYRCPIHSGDNDPSFIVYPIGTKGRNYQTYHCFGCQSGINIVNLKSDLDGVSIKESIGFFLKSINIDPVEVSDSIINNIQNDIQNGENTVEDDKQIEMILLLMNTTCRRYLDTYGDEEEVRFFDNRFYKKVDDIARSGDCDTLEVYYNMLIENNILPQRAENIRKRQEEDEISAVKWRI